MRASGHFSALQRAEIAEIIDRRFDPTATVYFSALQRAEIAEIPMPRHQGDFNAFPISVLFNEPKLLKSHAAGSSRRRAAISVLFNEPKLLKSDARRILQY